MTCNQCLGIEREFDRATAQRELRRYRRDGAGRSTRVLIEALLAAGVEGCTLLDIGGGVGAIQYALLERGATSATGVDASSAYLEAAHEEAARRGLAARVRGLHGDFVRLAPTIAEADIVTLDRVICCYHDMRSLVEESARRARTLYGIVYPREAWWLRPAFAIGNLYLRLRQSPFRVFLHSQREIDAGVARHGLRKIEERDVGVWRVAVFAGR
ncbi:MAG TPA: class I SAM-dependent methyltransferase [Anaerolineales bacterium]|nr:class I SAM-dependent methyltransferase [Anaerolineales bacterium]